MSSHDTSTQATATDDRAVLLNRIADTASELCDPSVHTEPRYGWTDSRNRKTLPPHRVTLPGLLTQLAEAIYPGQTAGGATSGGHAGSRPPANLDALSRHAAISVGSARWCWDVRVDLRDTVEGNIRSLVGAAPRMSGDQQALLLLDLCRWRTWASTCTGWRTPPVTPRAPCPACGAWSTLRVRVELDGDTLAVRSAYCTGTPTALCEAVWADDGLEALAGHIAAYTRASQGRALEARRVAREQAAKDREERGRRHLPDGHRVA